MFRNRRRAASNPASKTPPSASASLAATKAFVRDRESNASLSSAAAAAALRTHVTIPTPVGDTVTKRMVRKGSVSSQGSGSQQAPVLRRHSSSGSMTERSFRAPSPSRNSPVHHDAPPVPAVPKNVTSVGLVHRRASSLEPPARGGSPAGRGGGRGASLDRGITGTPGRGQSRASNLSRVLENDQHVVSQSVNFSRPISPQQTPPPQRVASTRGRQSGWFGGPVVNKEATFRGGRPQPAISDGVSGFDLQSAQQAVQNAADRPVSTKKSTMSHGVEGTRLASGSMRTKPSEPIVQSRQSQIAPRMVDPNSPYAVYDPSTRRFIHKQDAMALHREISDAEEHAPHYKTQPIVPRHQETLQQTRQESQPSQDQHAASPQELRTIPLQEYENDPVVATPTAVTAKFSDEKPQAPPSQLSLRPLIGAVSARRGSGDVFNADIKLTADANANQKLEPSVPDTAEQVPTNPLSSSLASSQDSFYQRLEPRSTFFQAGNAGIDRQGSVRSERTNSLSPPRNAHFAPVAVELPNGIKHQPPGRSVSPAKSALKSSPSVSRRSNSPLANDVQAVSRGLASETSDAMSDEGYKKKKKNVRVSFDEDPVVAGTSAYADADSSSSALGLRASRWSSTSEDQDIGDFMKPRPALPSFGSIRDKNRRAGETDVPEKVTETVTSSLSNSAISTSEPLESSSDHVVGSILAQHYATKNPIQPAAKEPLPPEVTSVEGSGYVSDSDQSDTTDYGLPVHNPNKTDQIQELAFSVPDPEPKTLTAPVEDRSPVPEVPVIAIQPASPNPTEMSQPKFRRPFVPGSWDEYDEENGEETDFPLQEKEVLQTNPMPPTTSTVNSEPLVHFTPEDETTDDDSSIYSDAYEDLTDTEDGGFGSIDAVVQSPATHSPTGLMSSKYASSGATESSKTYLRYEQVSNPGNTQTTAHFNNSDVTYDVDVPRKHQEQQQTVNPPGSTKLAVNVEDGISNTVARVDQVAPSPEQIEPTRKAPKTAAQPRKSAMKKNSSVQQATIAPEQQQKKTMNASSAPSNVSSSEPRIRKSMRGAPSAKITSPSEPYMRKSMRGTEATGASRALPGLAASRHNASPLDTKPPRGALQKRNIPTAVIVAATTAESVSRPRPQSTSIVPSKPPAMAPAYDSDSDASVSSFQRSRPRAPKKEGGRYTMRGSMRSGPTPTMRATPTMRPISPPSTSSPPAIMRTSMRPSSPIVASPVRSSKFSIRSLSPTGRFKTKTTVNTTSPISTQTPLSKKVFGISSKPKTRTVPTSLPKSHFKSRFDDSSDEDNDLPRRFQSRFADSDEDEEFELPPDLTPVRGIPKKPGEEDGDSTDLEDEASDTEPLPAQGAKTIEANRPLTSNRLMNGHGTNPTIGSINKSKNSTNLPTIEAGKKAKTKRGFFGLGKKKAPASYLEAEPTAPNVLSTDIPLPPEHRNRDHSRPLTPIGEDKDKEVSELPQRSPKLQRRNTPQWGRSTSDAWPLPHPPKTREDPRPKSSDGVVGRRSSLRPTLMKRNSSQTSEARTAVDPQFGKNVVFGHTGKKKKFQGLRRVFGLND